MVKNANKTRRECRLALNELQQPVQLKHLLVMGHWGNWPIWLVPIVCGLVYWGQVRGEVSLEHYAFIPAYKDNLLSWVSAQFMHANIVHFLMNMFGLLSIAPFVLARFGRGFGAILSYHVFYIVCGLAGNGLFYLLHPETETPLVGASGAIYGVFAAMMRLNLFSDKLYGILSKQGLKAWWFLIWTNLLVIVLFGGPLIALQLIQGAENIFMPIAWEAHVGGFIAGFFLIGLMRGRGWDGEWRAGIRLENLYCLLEDDVK